MDSVNNWKIILLQWIKECGFLENSFYSIEQTEIETFFLKFCEKLKNNVNKNEDLSSFLKEHYPRFEPHFDDENAISNNDYIYVYSLLLHFCCVKCPDEFFQTNCQQLKPAAQENIATFFKELVIASALTKEALRRAIASTSPFKAPRIYADSPVKTPQKPGISPPTPRSCKLQEKSKELISLKAQLENEAYEKGLLELEAKQNQEKIFKLSQELKRAHQDLQHLKNDILSENTDNCDSEIRHSEDEQTNRRLSKQILQKETEIAKHREDIETLTEQKEILTEKLKHAERQIKTLQNKIEEFALKVDELSNELEEIPSLDDSSSTLLNTGQRKKVSGATSYKRPGPPTPSKNAGRLSFGGIGELNREILKESLDTGNYTLSSKTPAKFKLFSSKMKDENKNCVLSFKRKKPIIGAIQCSSTPRKSKAHYDQRRLLDQIMSAPADSPLSLVSPAVHLQSPLTLARRLSQKLRPSKLSCATPNSEVSDINSPICKEAISKPSKRYKDRRSSLHLRGTMFARSCRTPSMGFREVFKNKSKMQRNATFNKYRREALNQLIVKKASVKPSPCNNNTSCSKANKLNNLTIEESKEGYMCSPYNSGISDNIALDEKSSKHFQQLLTTKESHAPFEISEINGPSYVNSNSNSSSAVHSRIIYGASVILNRRIPNVNTTLVRKSSIYVKAKDGQGIILVTNQSITLMDLAQMWIQMNVSAKIVISVSLITLCVFLLSIVIQFFL